MMLCDDTLSRLPAIRTHNSRLPVVHTALRLDVMRSDCQGTSSLDCIMVYHGLVAWFWGVVLARPTGAGIQELFRGYFSRLVLCLLKLLVAGPKDLAHDTMPHYSNKQRQSYWQWYVVSHYIRALLGTHAAGRSFPAFPARHDRSTPTTPPNKIHN